MHSHILPAFDDGAKTVEDSLELIDHLRQQGVRNICLTPHFYTNELSYKDYLVKREKAFRAFEPHIPDDIRIVLGSEVYVTEYIFNNQDLSGITYGNSPYILTEFAYGMRFTEKEMQQFYQLIQNFRLIPVMPHVERYENLMNSPDKIAQLKDIGVVIQTNIGNYTKKSPFFRKRKLLKLIDRGLIDILGSDTHSMKHNRPDVFAEALETISQKCGEKKLVRMMDNAAKIFNNAL